MSSRKTDAKAATPSRLIPFALAGSAMLVVAAAGLFYYATQTATGPERGDIHKVTVADGACDPADFTIPAGRATFEIHNASTRPIEWEILDGVYVVEERENIAPGFHSLLTAKLRPGSYEITCGLLSSPRGRLTVTASEQSEAERVQPPITAFVGPLSEYKVFLIGQSSALVTATQKLAEAIGAGDLDGAREAWQAARLPYKRMEAVSNRLADLENVIDPLSDYLEQRENDPAFTGFHRIEYGLFGQNSLDGLASVADQLLVDVTELKTRLRAIKLLPQDLADAAQREALRLSEGQIASGENRWSFSDLAEIEANLDGLEKSVSLILPLVRDADPGVAQRVTDDIAAARAALAGFRSGDAYPSYDSLDEAARAGLAAAFQAVANAISALNPAIGLG